MEKNYLSSGLKNLGTAFFIITVLCAALFAIWTFAYKSTSIVRASQPFFLLCVAFGTVLSVATMPFLAMDDSEIEPEKCINETDGTSYDCWPSLDFACQIVPFLYCAGFVFSFASLFAKTWRVNKIFSTNSFKVVVVTIKEAFVFVAIGLVVEIGICFAWTAVDPLVWVRNDVTFQNYHGRNVVVETAGKCDSLGGGAMSFLVPLVLCQLFAYAFGCYLCFKSRNIETRFSEHKWISLALFNNIQIFVIAIPLVAMVINQPGPYFLMKLFVIVLNDLGVLILIFVPKIFVFFGVVQPEGTGLNKTAATRNTQSNNRSEMSSTSNSEDY